MKKTVTYMLLLVMALFGGQIQAQNTFVDDLEECVNLGQDIQTWATQNRSALRTLTIDFFQYNNPNPDVAGYLATMQTLQGNIEAAQDDITYYANQAASKNPNIDVSNITYWASQIEAREDYVQIESQNLATAIANGNRQQARAAVVAIRGYLAEQISLANDIINEATALQSTPSNSYNVRIQLIYNGVPYNGSTTLQGFYGYDHQTSQYFYPDYQDDHLFSGLTGGTYTFDSFDGYFDGTGSTTVTLIPSLVNGNGEVVVNLSYWSE